MCTIAAAGLAFSAFGTLASFAAQRQQGAAAEASAQFNAQVQANNAIIARQQATQAHDVGKVESAKEQLEARKLAGLQRATLAGNAVRIDTGSAADIVQDTRDQAAVDASTIRSNAAREALGFLTQAGSFDAQSGLSLAEGANAASAANTEAFGTLLGGASSVAGKWQAYKTAGVL